MDDGELLLDEALEFGVDGFAFGFVEFPCACDEEAIDLGFPVVGRPALNGRLSTFGLADIRGAVGAGFDEGAWITTAQTAAQMLITVPAVWMGATFGPRRVLIGASIAFALISLLTPFSPNLSTLLTMQFLGGLASGFFIPLTLSFVLLNTPPKYWAFGIALYALNLELSLNISASLEGWYVEHHSWRWIFWQNVPLALIMSQAKGSGPFPASGQVKR